MSSKKWLIMFFCAVALALALCACFNIVVDPFGVFGDAVFDWYSYNETNNPRVAKLEYLDEHHEEYDSYIIGSSSAASYNTDELNEYMDAKFYNLFVYGCDTKDYRGFAEYVIENYEVKNILLNLGMNEATDYDIGNDTINNCEHYKAYGGNALEFYFKYAFCNPQYSVEKITSFFKDTYLPQPFDVFDVESGCYDKRVRDVEKIGDIDAYMSRYSSTFAGSGRISSLGFIDECAESVKYIKELCDKNNVNLIVVFSPVFESQWNGFYESEIREYKEKMAEITDYWDFSYSSVSFDSRYFYDDTHFRNAVGSMILAKIFDNDNIYCPEDFGAVVTRENVSSYVDSLFKASPKENYTVDVPILMYHHLAETGDSGATMAIDHFISQLDALCEAGYNTVTMEDLINYVHQGTDLPENPICITFDDGYMSNYDVALDILRERNMTATVFAIGSSIGKSTYKDTDHEIIPHFGYDEINSMYGVIDVQSHTYDMHQASQYEVGEARTSMAKLTGETDEAFAAAIRNDANTFSDEYEQNTGRSITAMAYPNGKYSTLSEVIVHEEGVKVSLSTDTNMKNTIVKGLPQSLYALCRYNMTDKVSVEDMLALIS